MIFRLGRCISWEQGKTERALRYWSLALVVTLALALLPLAGQAQNVRRCFPETGFCIEGRIREYWEQNGGLAVFGYPISSQREEIVESQTLQIQWFERHRLELHPANARPYDVLLGRLGAQRLGQQGRDWWSFPRSEPRRNCRFFPETGHNVCSEFLAAWRAHGLELDGLRGKTEFENLALFGLPLSDMMTETIDGRTYTVQWFERARFELHPENQPPYNVLFGLLGKEIGRGLEPAPLPTPPPIPTQAPTTGPAFNCQVADPTSAPNTPIYIVGINKAAELVSLRNVSSNPVDLTGWKLCSLRGNQLHSGIGGILAPGETRDFINPGGEIWSDIEEDDGALFDASGRLISFWDDA